VIYLDNAATTYPKPKSVYRAVNQALKKYGVNSGRSGYKAAVETSMQVYRSRQAVAELFGCSKAENVVFTQNCTAALNICIKSLAEKGCNFICTDLEHNAVARVLEALKQKGVCDYKIAHVDRFNDAVTVNNFNTLIDEKTVAVVLTAASNVFGVKTPYEKIAALCKKRGVRIIVDAAQAAGIVPINISESGIDYLCIAAHKGLYAPAGLGILVAGDGAKLSPLTEGGTGSNSLSLSQPDFLPDMLESGTLNISSIIALRKGVEKIRSIGLGEVYSHEYSLMKLLESELSNMKNVILYVSFCNNEPLVPVLSFNIRGKNSEQTALELDKYGVAVRAGYHCAGLAHKAFGTLGCGTVRISPSIFTKKSDIYSTINYINKLQN
jgi:cysteine desulfurase family protein